MRDGLVALLAGESTVNALVGSRVYVHRAPQGAAYPHIVITQMSTEEFKSLDQTSGLRMITFDIDCKAKTSLGSVALANAVRVFLDDFTGTAGSYTIQAVLFNDEADDYESPEDGSDNGVYVVTLDMDIQYNPA